MATSPIDAINGSWSSHSSVSVDCVIPTATIPTITPWSLRTGAIERIDGPSVPV